MNLSRRDFVIGAASWGALGGCRMFRADSNFRAGDAPRLRFGVVSDVHQDLAHLQRALEYFRSRNVDAVLSSGDWTDCGLISELENIATVWNRVFPANRAPDGHVVEKLFVTGNHDWEGQEYGKSTHNRFPDPDEFARHILRTDYAGNWERIFGEPYAPVWMKEVKGYTFVGAHWVGDGKTLARSCNGHCETFNTGIRDFYAAHGGEIDPSKPFFHIQHPHPKDTCYGPWAWGRDDGESTKVLSAFPNAVVFSGHSHYSLTDERSVWQGAFTSIGAGSLHYTGHPYDCCRPHAYENTGLDPASKVMPELKANDGKQGMLVSVYDDAIVIERREFRTGLSLGADWVIPLPLSEKKFTFSARAARTAAPEFPAAAAVRIAKTRAKTRKFSKVEPVEKDAWEIRFPAAVPQADLRVHEYELTFVGEKGEKAVKRLLAPGYHQPVSNEAVSAEVVCTVPADGVPAAPFRVEVRPLSCWLKPGKAIVASV